MVKPVSGACNAHQALSTIPATHVLLSSASSQVGIFCFV